MAKIRLLILETHSRTIGQETTTSGVDAARLVVPGRELAKLDDFEVEIRKEPFTDTQKNWDEVTQNFDLIYTSYIDSEWGYVQLALFCQKNGCIHIQDIDDNLWQVPKKSPVYETYHPGSERLHILSCIVEDCKHIVCTNEYLKGVLMKYNGKTIDQIKVLPNYIDLTLYDYQKIKPVIKDKLTISYHGSATHYPDLTEPAFLNGMTRILKEFPHVEFKTTGMFFPELKTKWGKQYNHVIGQPDFWKWTSETWPKIMSESEIVVAPLLENEFSRSKSPIKFLECSAAKRPGVYQNIRQYNEVVKDGVNGYLAKSGDEWYTKLKELITNEDLRRKMGQVAYQSVKDNWTIQGNINQVADYFRSVYHNTPKTANLQKAGFLL